MEQVLLASIESGLVFSLLAIGVVITFKILDIADLSVEGTFPLGAFVVGRFLTLGMNPFVSLIIAFIAGGIAGYITFFLYKKFKIEAILSGILTMTMLYSINLRITGKSNVPLFDYKTIFDVTPLPRVVLLLILVLIVKLLLDWFFKTEKGYLLVVTGDNEQLVKSLGKDPDKYTMAGLVLSNAIVGLSGAVQAQAQGFVDITMGQGMIVMALASIVIGDTFMRNSRRLKLTTRAIIGSICYRLIYGIAIEAGLNPNDLKGITAVIVVAFIVYNNVVAKRSKAKITRRNEDA